MTFRETVPSDAVAHRLLTDYFASRAAGFTGPQGYTVMFPSDAVFTPPHGLFLVIGSEGQGSRGQGIGCGGIRAIEPGADGHVRFEVKHLWVDPSARGSGLGGRLLVELERRARALGATEIVLDTNANLTAAAGLYASHGYTAIAPYNDNPNATNWYGKRLHEA